MLNLLTEDNIIYKKLVKTKVEGTPTILPNNLKKIKKAYGYTEKELAEILGVSINNLNAVINHRVAISGTKICNLMDTLNIPFVSIFSTDGTAPCSLEEKNDYIYIIKNENEIKDIDVIKNNLCQLINNKNCSTTIEVINVTKLKYKNDFYLDIGPKDERFLGSGLADILRKEISHFEGSEPYNRNNKYYMFVVRETSSTSGEINLNALDKIDMDFANIFFKIPFKKVEQIKLSLDKYTIENEIIRINDNKIYNIITREGIIATNVISKKDLVFLKEDKIAINILTDTPHINKFKLFRIMKGLTTIEMANKLGVKTETYSLIERGCQKMSLKVMWKVEHEVGIFLHDILDIKAYKLKLCKN